MFVRSFCRRAGTAARCSSRRVPMPLRAKVTDLAFTRRAHMSTDKIREPSPDAKPSERIEVKKEQEEEEENDVLFDTLFGIRKIELNRPRKLHSLNRSMAQKIIPRLQEWEKSDMANIVIIKGSGPKAFCAGGDVTTLALDNTAGEKGQQKSIDYFALEYRLDHLIATYSKPYVAFMDGITMGGGVGLSIHAPFRIATERTLFAMPETTIGFFPDVGASFFLPRMPGGVGTYLALTSEKLRGVNVFYAGVATHYIHSTSLPALESRLAELRFKDYESLPERLDLINATIEEFCTGLPHDQPMLLRGELRNAIDRCFEKNSVPEILAALNAEEGETKQWAEKTLATLHQRSPTSVHVALRQMRLGREWSIAETFQREHQIAAKFMRHPDFTEGVHALLIRKDGQPKWQPASLESIEPEDDIARPFFEVEGEQRLRLLNERDYKEYPHKRFGIPQEREVRTLVQAGEMSRNGIVKHFVEKSRGKQGVQEVVLEILRRKTRKEDDKLIWSEDSTAVEESTAAL